jgi:hypothetical protein
MSYWLGFVVDMINVGGNFNLPNEPEWVWRSVSLALRWLGALAICPGECLEFAEVTFRFNP